MRYREMEQPSAIASFFSWVWAVVIGIGAEDAAYPIGDG